MGTVGADRARGPGGLGHLVPGVGSVPGAPEVPVTLTMLQATPKCWAARYVSEQHWLELAAWRTSKSGMSGWRWENTAKGRGKAWGRRLITPALGFALWVE